MLRPEETQLENADLENTTVQGSSPESEQAEMIYPVKKPPAPKWSKNVDDRVSYACWMLNWNPQVYIAYRCEADAQRLKNPSRRISSEDIVNKLRHHTLIRADGDYFKVNSNAKSLFAELYKLERTDAKIGKKPRWLDHLTDEQWQPILAALKKLNDTNS
jgi:hypothetical protein